MRSVKVSNNAAGRRNRGTQVTLLTPAPGEDRSIALAMVNTLTTGAADRLGTVDEATGWLESHAFRVRAVDLGRLAALRGAVRELFTALADERVPDAGALDLVNAVVRDPSAAPHLEWSEEGPRRHWRSEKPGSLDEAIMMIARDAVEVVCGDKASVVRRCEAHGCVRIFFREHARRRWCSTTCGDRVRAARHHRLKLNAQAGESP
jgi:predicted RNA-binding Zn ribbon-like protein